MGWAYIPIPTYTQCLPIPLILNTPLKPWFRGDLHLFGTIEWGCFKYVQIPYSIYFRMMIYIHTYYLVGGLEHFLFFHILGISSSQLTNSIIFQRGRYTTNQIYILLTMAWYRYHGFPGPLGRLGQAQHAQRLHLSWTLRWCKVIQRSW